MNDDTTFEDLVETYLDALRDGSAPGIEEFAGLHPEYADRLRDLLPLMVRMEDCATETATARKQAVSRDEFPDMSGSDYRLIRRIGAGGMGEVFEATQISLDRKVAVKLLSPRLTADPAQRDQFENEARVIAMLHHPNIVQILNAGVCAERCYYAMELIDGKGLDRCRIDDPREIARLGLQAARALAYAHSCHVLHRDVKPANLLLDAQGDVHIGDFGLAFVLEDAAGRSDSAGRRIGTLRYMAPERLTKGVNSYAGDQYSFGVTLYELVTHAPVLAEKDPDKLTARISSGPLPPLKCPDRELAAIINRCTAFDPANRYPGMEEAAADLEHFLRHEPVTAAPPSPIRRFRLWAKRKPAEAALSTFANLAAGAFAVAVTVGYFRTNAALKLAEKNAAAANAALSDIFAHIEHRAPTSSGSELLSRLMPYYQEIAMQGESPQSRIAAVNRIIGTAAMRSGNYPLAENAFRRVWELESDPGALTQLASSLRLQGKTAQADETARQVIDLFPDSCEAVDALQSLGQYEDAFALILSLLRQDPGDPEYRYQYALLLENRPELAEGERVDGVEPNAAALLLKLAEEHPDHMEYALSTVDLMNRRLHAQERIRPQDRNALEQALALSDRLLAQYPNTPEVATSVVDMRTAYIALLRRNNDQASARKEEARLQGMLEILYRSPDAPDTVKESLLSIQLGQLAQMTASRLQPFQELAEKISSELNDYRGERLGEFQEKLLQLSSRAGVQVRPVRTLLMRNRGRNAGPPAEARAAQRPGWINRPGGANPAGPRAAGNGKRGEQASGNQQRQQNIFFRREQSPGGTGNGGNPPGNQQRQQPSPNRGEQASGTENRGEQTSLDRGEQASGGGSRRAL